MVLAREREREKDKGREDRLGCFSAWVGMGRKRRAGVGVMGGEKDGEADGCVEGNSSERDAGT
jgi:hypothetical protein